MKKILDVRHFIILILFIIIFILKSDNNVIIKKEVERTPIEVIHDTIPQEVPIYIKGENIYHDTIIYVPTFTKVDTLEILKDLYSRNLFMDTIRLNNNQGFVYLMDSISQNKIIYRKWSSLIKPKIIRENTQTISQIKNELFLGIDGSWSQKDWVNSIGVGAIFKTKKNNLYHVGVGVANRTTNGISGEFTPYINGGTYWKIKIKKK
jgi:hypothetical protein